MATVRHFYINDRKVEIEISPQLANTLDETLDNFNVTEIANKDYPNPYDPISNKFYIKDEDDNIIQAFIISADSVELATQNPLRYKHHLSLVQKSEYLTKHETRNTVFSNSFSGATENGYVAALLRYDGYNKNIRNDQTNYSLTLSSKKVENMFVKVDFFVTYQTNAYIHEYVEPGTDPDIVLICEYNVEQDYDITKWSQIWSKEGLTINHYPRVKFAVGTSSVYLQLGDFENGEKIKVPKLIIDWINSFNSGTLEISVENPFDSPNLAGFNLELETVNCPVFSKLSFDLEINIIENSVYEVIDTLLKQQMKETEAYNSTYDSNIKPLFKMPTADHNADLYNLLNNTSAPNFVFTQSTMYDALAEIFKLFDAIFTIDNDGYLDIEYFNDSQIKINEPKKAGKTSSLSEQRFTNRLLTYFQNTKIDDRFPNSNSENATAFIRSKTLGVPKQEDFVFATPKPIDIIKRAYIKADFNITQDRYDVVTPAGYQYDYFEMYFYFDDVSFNKVVDITDNVIEASLWTLLPRLGSQQPSISKKYKETQLTYERGSRYIELGKYYSYEGQILLNLQQQILTNVVNTAIRKSIGTNDLTGFSITRTIDMHAIKMSVEYIALVDGKLVNESLDKKYDGESLINQSNGSIDINKLGLNMVGLSLKLGQPTLNMTQVFSKWDDRVKKGQYFIDENGDRWVANNCVYTIIKPDLVQTNIEFVKNFNSLATRIELNREKRLSNISNELTTKCEETYGEFVYYSAKSIIGKQNERIVFDSAFLANQICMTFNTYIDNKNKIEYALLTAYDSSNNVIDNGDQGGEVKKIAIPMVVYGSGNSVCFEMSFEHPMSAGTRLMEDSELWDGGWFSSVVLYTDKEGKANNFDIEFVKLNEELTRYFPSTKKDATTYIDTTQYGKISHLKYYKKPNEIFALNYQLHFMPVEKTRDFLNNEWIKNNAFANGINIKQLKIKASATENYSILDVKAEGNAHVINSITPTVSISGWGGLDLKLEFSTNATAEEWTAIKSWAICDEDDNIYFATNTAPSEDPSLNTGEFAIYFKSRHHRI